MGRESLWFDPWLKGGTLAEIIGREEPEMINNPHRKVSELIQNKAWNISLPSLEGIGDQVFMIDIHAQQEDYWV